MSKLRILLLALTGLLCFGVSSAQTTITIPNTAAVSTPVDRFGMTIGPVSFYNQGQLYKDLGVADGGYIPAPYAQTVFTCDTSKTQTTTTYFSQQGNSTVYWPVHAWQNGSYELHLVSSSGDSIVAQGTITDSTNNAAADIQITMGAPTSGTATACTSSMYLLTRQLANIPGASLAQTQDRYTSGMTASSDVPTVTINGQSYTPQQSLALATGTLFQLSFDTGTTSTLNLNGSYTQQFWAKCATAGCSIAYKMGRLNASSPYLTGSVSPTTSWAQYQYPVTLSETYNSTKGNGYIGLTCTGSCIVWGSTVVEGSTLAGNTTVFRDAVVRRLQAMNNGVLRFMNKNDWPTRIADAILPFQVARQAIGNTDYGIDQTDELTYSYRDDLALALLVNADAWITIGNLNSPADLAALPTFLSESCTLSGCPGTSAQSWNSMYQAAGRQIFFEPGNEQWGGGPASTQLNQGNGNAYGGYLKTIIPVLRTASGWNSAVDQIIASGFYGNFNGAYGWYATTLIASGCTSLSATPNNCPDQMDLAPYVLNTVANTTDTYHDEVAEATNVGSVNASSSSPSIPAITAWLAGKGIKAAIYEANVSPTNVTTGMTAAQVASNIDSVGQAMNIAEMLLNGQRDGKMTGPANEFGFVAYSQSNVGNNGTSGPIQFSAWGSQQYMACGPGQLSSCTDVEAADGIVFSAINNAIGTNNIPLAVTQSGGTFSNYAGGQAGTIAANSSVPDVNCFANSTASFSSYSVLCFNHTTSTKPIVFAGAGAPSAGSAVTRTIIGGTATPWTASNDTATLPGAATAAPIPEPTSSAFSGSTDNLQPESLTLYTFNTAQTQAAAPVFVNGTNNYQASFNESLTDATSGATLTWGYAASKSLCTPNTTLAAGATIYVSASEYLCAYATAPGYAQSATTYAAYTMGYVALPPVFSVNGGTFGSPVTLSLSAADTTPPAATTADNIARVAIYWTSDGSAPDATSNEYLGVPITVSSSQTIKAIAEIIGTEQINNTGAVTYWKAPDHTDAGASGVPTAVTDPTSGSAPANGLASSGCYSNSGTGPCLKLAMTPPANTQTNVLWAKSSAIPHSRCDDCTRMKGDHWEMFGPNANLASKFENDNYNWLYKYGYNIQGSGQLCAGGASICGSAAASDLDVGGNAGVPWTHTQLHPNVSYNTFHHIVKLEHFVLAELTTKPCTTSGGTAMPCVYSDKYIWDGNVGNLQNGTCTGTGCAASTFNACGINGCKLPAETLSFSVGYATDQFQIDSETSSPASITMTIDSSTFTALYDPSAIGTQVYSISQTGTAAPVLNPASGIFYGSTTVTMTDATSGAVIYYTTNGSQPTSASTQYTSPITLNQTTTINAIAIAGGVSSPVNTSQYTLGVITVTQQLQNVGNVIGVGSTQIN